MNTTILKVDNSSEMALAFLEYVKSLPFVKVEVSKGKKKNICFFYRNIRRR